MKKPVVQISLLFVALRLATAAFIVTVTAASAFADIRNNLSCTVDDYSPQGLYPAKILRDWVPERIRIEIWENNDVKVYFSSGRVAHGEVKRENSNKIAMDAVVEVRDDVGRETFMTYTLDWFKSSGKIFVDALPQGYNPIGTAKGNCKVATGSKAPAKPRTPDSVFGKAPDTRVCDMAIRLRDGEWDQRQTFILWVDEARKRGLKPRDCVKLLEAN
jgi:hypothetical protein